jgi:hypothetical protein
MSSRGITLKVETGVGATRLPSSMLLPADLRLPKVLIVLMLGNGIVWPKLRLPGDDADKRRGSSSAWWHQSYPRHRKEQDQPTENEGGLAVRLWFVS